MGYLWAVLTGLLIGCALNMLGMALWGWWLERGRQRRLWRRTRLDMKRAPLAQPPAHKLHGGRMDWSRQED